MYQRDYLLTEARKLALLLAKLMSLKAEEEYDEYVRQFNDALQDEYGVELKELLNLNEAEFIIFINSAGYSAEKLHALAQMLYVSAEPLKIDNETGLTLRKILIIFDLLEQRDRQLSFENIEKRKIIYKHLIKIHERP